MTTSSVLAHDANWQYPAITEEHAYRRAMQSLPEVEGLVYFGFPWATLFDLVWHGKSADRLLDSLKNLTGRLRSGPRVVTVCQHIRLREHLDLLVDAGITDIFWSHAVRGDERFPEQVSVNIFPFPLYPVQAMNFRFQGSHPRPVLFSFVGAKGEECYLSPARKYIVESLGSHPRGVVRARGDWHYRGVVYGDQIGFLEKSIRDSAALGSSEKEFRYILLQSVFSLCPCGSGPNTIRLWESLGLGSIPVVLSGTWQPPGDQRLWEDAVVFCDETPEEIKKIPLILDEIHRNKVLLENKRHACRELWMRYGPEGFIHDIQYFYTNHARTLASNFSISA